MTQFAETLVYDERVGVCYGFDPQDEGKRRLQGLTEQDCYTFDCFDCGRTAGVCKWDPKFEQCLYPRSKDPNKPPKITVWSPNKK